MSAKVTYRGFNEVVRALDRVPAHLQKDMVDVLHEDASRIESDIKGAAHTRMERRAAGTVHVDRIAEGIDIRGGGGGGLGDALFAGAEFGGHKQQKETYRRRGSSGRVYAVRRRVTMQFFPHTGTEGIFFWPTIREWIPVLERQQIELLEQLLGGE